MLVRRENAGSGLAFLAPVSDESAAESLGLGKSADVHALRVTAPNRKGIGAEITKIIADEGIDLRGLSAHASGQGWSTWLAFSSDADARNALLHLQGQLGAPDDPGKAKLMPGEQLGIQASGSDRRITKVRGATRNLYQDDLS